MGADTSIEWTDATWNPIAGCSLVSPGCKRCYAMRVAARMERLGQARYAGLTLDTDAGPVWNGTVRLVEQALALPLQWRRPRHIFVNSMSDLFHEGVPDDVIDSVFAVMALAPRHTFQVLTKRADRMRRYISQPVQRGAAGYEHVERPWPLPNVWLGVSVEDQPRADERVHELRLTPAAIRFISAEPLLGPIDLTRINDVSTVATDALRGIRVQPNRHGEPIDDDQPMGRIDWVIAGGESGPGARPMHPDWARSLRDQCQAAGVAFHFKQHGEWLDDCADADPRYDIGLTHARAEGRLQRYRFPDGTVVERVGKRAAGRLLDGREHNDFPDVPR